MDAEQAAIRDFMTLCRQTVNDRPTIPSERDRDLRIALIEEELREFREAAEVGNLIGVADALADLIYVVKGAGNTYGIDLEPVFSEVQASNMAKGVECPNCRGQGTVPGEIASAGLWLTCLDCERSGKVVIVREDGKILKPEDWRPPELAPIIQAQECRP